jgi:hypothetical protein
MKKLLAGHISTGAVVAGLTIALQSMALAAGPSPLAATVKRGDVAAARAILRRGPCTWRRIRTTPPWWSCSCVRAPTSRPRIVSV